jgi:hypothetical protein
MFEFRASRVVILCAVPAFAGAWASAQTPAAAPPAALNFAVIEGVVVDSLHRDYLRRAILMVEGARISATTDSLGRFRLDSVPPGLRRINVVHPLLDTLGISLQTRPLQLTAGQRLDLIIATPSAQAVVAIKCTAAERSIGPAALLGVVQYSESEMPATGSRVSLDWIDYEISGNSIRTVPRRRIATVSATGRFQICGIPNELSAELTAARDGDTTSAIGVQLSSFVTLVGLELPEPLPNPITASGGARDSAGLAATGAGSGRGTAVLIGRVFGPTGAPLERARVAVDRDSAYVLTGPDGGFELRNLRSGTRAVTVRRLGFKPVEQVVSLRARTPTQITVKLGEFVAILDTVRITAIARDLGLERVGFSQRKKRGTGYYLTPEEIARRYASQLADLLTAAPMLRRTYINGRLVITGRPSGLGHGCVTYFVDGATWMGGGIEDFISPGEVAAVEVYSIGFTPGQFMGSFRPCETVVIWTKQKIGVR